MVRSRVGELVHDAGPLCRGGMIMFGFHRFRGLLDSLGLTIAVMLFTVVPAMAQTDPLPSWNDGQAKAAIIDFVARVTAEGSPDFVPVSERVAVFDNDGTLGVEQPI